MSNETLEKTALKAYQVMSHPLFTVNATDSIRDVAGMFLEYNISGAPVLGKEGTPIGVITKTDVVRFERDKAEIPLDESPTAAVAEPDQEGTAEMKEAEERVEKWMTPTIFSVSSEAGVEEACRAMVRHGTHHIFVRDDAAGRLLGVVTSFDLLRVLADELKRKTS